MISFRKLFPVVNQITRRHGVLRVCKSSVSSQIHTETPESNLTGAPATNLEEHRDTGQPLQDCNNSKGMTKMTKEDPDHSENLPGVVIPKHRDVASSARMTSDIFQKLTKSIDVTGLKPKLPTRSPTVVPYVNDSETLSRLVKMGVNLTSTEQDAELGNFLLRADFKRDIQPVMLLLMRDLGLNEEDVVKVLSSNLRLVMEHIEDLHARVNFLRYMKFSKTAIQTIIRRNANFLSYPTKDVDRACGFVQQLLAMSGNETRALLTAYPSKKLIYGDLTQTQAVVDMMQELEGFSLREVKRMCLKYPRVLTYGHQQIARALDYVADEMGMARKEVLACPYVFNPRGTRTAITRHKYLKLIKRDQFNPKKANYVSLESIVDMDDEVFCDKVAKRPLKDFYDFQKTL